MPDADGKPLKAKNWAEVEQIAGIRRTHNPAVTQRDVANLTRKRLKGPFWKFPRR